MDNYIKITDLVENRWIDEFAACELEVWIRSKEIVLDLDYESIIFYLGKNELELVMN